MKAKYCISFFLIALLLKLSAANNYCYLALFTTNQPLNGTVATRSSEIETAVNNVIEEFQNDASLGFSISSSNSTLEDIRGTSNNSEYLVTICLVNSTFDQNQFTNTLETFNILTQIDATTPSAGDFDECDGNYSTNCDSLASCENNNGGFRCVCPSEYADRSASGAPGQICVSPTNHSCSDGTIEIVSYLSYFTQLGINETTLLLNRDCSGTVSGENLIFRGQCAPVIESNGTHNIYQWNLTNINPNEEITTGNYVLIPFSCSFVSNGSVNTTVRVILENQEGSNFFINNEDISSQIQVDAFSDNSFINTLSTGSSIPTNMDLFFRMGPRNGFISDNIKTVCQGFTSGPAESTSSQMTLIRNGCKVNSQTLSPLLNSLQIFEQGTRSFASLTIKSHFFFRSTRTRFRFQINICLETGGATCTPSCINSRRRRSFYTVRMKRQSDDQSSNYGYFEFVRTQDDKLCTRECGRGVCVIDQVEEEQCACDEEFTYKDENGICKPIDQPIPENKFPFIVLISIVSVFVLVLLLLVMNFICWQRRKKDPRLLNIL